WRRKEFNIRQQCGLDPVPGSYPGCFPLFRERDLKEEKASNLRERRFDNNQAEKEDDASDDEILLFDAEKSASDEYSARHSYNPTKPFKTVADIFYFNSATGRNSTLELEDVNYEPAVEKDWDSWIKEQSQKMNQHEELYNKLKENDYGGKHTDDLHRQLIMGDEMEWYNYWPLIGVRTEYYYRYQGTATIPPCYGNDTQGTRRGTNHWRVLKDPIRIHPRQLEELNRLIRERIAPPDDAVNPCQPDTAADVSDDGSVNTARPLMYHNTAAHAKTFCECKDWESKWPEDRNWCVKYQDINERYYDHPYNFDTNGQW
ncbi:MAG: hypothetical protein SGILL_010794, partial [Bacillariaceae sp.]